MERVERGDGDETGITDADWFRVPELTQSDRVAGAIAAVNLATISAVMPAAQEREGLVTRRARGDKFVRNPNRSQHRKVRTAGRERPIARFPALAADPAPVTLRSHPHWFLHLMRAEVAVTHV